MPKNIQVISREEERRAEAKKQRAFRRQAVTGQVPEVVETAAAGGGHDEVVIIEDDDEDAEAEVRMVYSYMDPNTPGMVDGATLKNDLFKATWYTGKVDFKHST